MGFLFCQTNKFYIIYSDASNSYYYFFDFYDIIEVRKLVVNEKEKNNFIYIIIYNNIFIFIILYWLNPKS